MMFTLNGSLLLVACLALIQAAPVPGGSKPPPPQRNDANSLTELWGTEGNKYPTVFIHGLAGWSEQRPILGFLNYWGGATQNLLEVTREQGFTVVAPGVGPLSSNWERACEAFAQLTGTKTDYGVERSVKFGHSRYGEDWTGKAMLPEFAANFKPSAGKVQKINMVGHSMGGPTARMLTHFLTYGSQVEMDACTNTKTVCSPLFWTNKTTSYVNSVLALSGTHQGSQVDDYLHATKGLVNFVKGLFATLVGVNNFNKVDVWDLQLGHWGLDQRPSETFPNYLERVCASPWFLGKSNAFFDLSVAFQSDSLLSFVKNSPDTTYFSVAGRTTNYVFGVALAEITTNLFLIPFANLIGTYSNSSLPALRQYNQEDWRQNDGLVSIASSRSPSSGYKDFNLDMSASSSRDLATTAPARVPQKGTYNYLGELDNVDHAAFLAWFDPIPGLRDDLYVNIMRVIGSVAL
ncbi:Alpha/Beta hydrolase protein [Chytriomyces sp. MP71]|nr:Alpha/Beta hydrolase protein [Chytriomyces sp. MP71]